MHTEQVQHTLECLMYASRKGGREEGGKKEEQKEEKKRESH